jgi:plasmid stability protein
MVQERKMMVRMTEDLHKAVRVKAAELGRSISEIVRELLKAWVAGEIETPAYTEFEGETPENN